MVALKNGEHLLSQRHHGAETRLAVVSRLCSAILPDTPAGREAVRPSIE
jgi:hypothetical protein